MSSATPTQHSVPSIVARLPSGQILVPGAEPEISALSTRAIRTCAGPDAWDRCPLMLEGADPICRDAVWYRGDQDPSRSWRFTFTADEDVTQSGVCPVAILRPLGGLVYDTIAALEAAPDPPTASGRAVS